MHVANMYLVTPLWASSTDYAPSCFAHTRQNTYIATRTQTRNKSDSEISAKFAWSSMILRTWQQWQKLRTIVRSPKHAYTLTEVVGVFRCNLPPALVAEWPGSFMCHCGNMGVEQTPNKSQYTKLTLEKKTVPLLLLGFELATFRSWVWRSYQQAILAPWLL